MATRRVRALVRAGARVVVVSPHISDELRARVELGEIEYIAETYQPHHLEGAFLAFAATDDADVNEAVRQTAQARRILINVASKAAHSDFHLPSTVHAGVVQIAISTTAKSPSTAKALREALQSDLLDGGTRFVEMLRTLPPDLVRAPSADGESEQRGSQGCEP